MQVLISGTDHTKKITLDSLIIENVLTRQVDRCSFTIRSIYGFKPNIGSEVIIYDNDSNKIFGGIITRVTSIGQEYKLVDHLVDCLDYTKILDRKLINKSYENQTINEIIDDINTNYLDGDNFTINNVNAPVSVSYVGFKYTEVSNALQQLADLVNYDWYIDYDKDIHFFSKTSENAPFDIQDNDGSYIYDSLILRDDTSQVRNIVYVRGGEYLGTQFTSNIEADGQRRIYDIGYRYKDLSVTLTGNSLDIGLDAIDNPNDYDVLWNFQEKIIKFKEDDKPSNDSIIKVGGKPYLPVIVQAKNQDSIDYFSTQEGGSGKYEYLIIDKSIDSKEGARDRAKADLKAYSDTLIEGEFSTYTSGLKAGQRIRINSSSRNVDDYYLINKVVYSMYTSNTFRYDISVVSTRTFGIIDFLRGLVSEDKKKLTINPDEILDLLETRNEEISLSETVTSSLEHNLQEETVTMDETFTAQSLDYEVEFVTGPQTPPSGTKRIFLIGGSSLH